MFIYSGIGVAWNPWILICHLPVSFVPCKCRPANQSLRASSNNKALKMNITVIFKMSPLRIY